MEAIDAESDLAQKTRADKLAAQNKALQEQLVGGGFVLTRESRSATGFLPWFLSP
jgi:hypothetical protein